MRCRPIYGFVSLLMLWASACAHAQVLFERGTLRIDPVAEIKVKKGDKPPKPRKPVSYEAELRSEESLQLEYIHSLNSLDEKTAVAIGFTVPSMAALPRMQVFTPVDALFIAEDGTILQIYPNVVLAELQQDFTARDPVKAFLFLKAGEVTKRRIMPRDIVAGSLFIAAPPLME